MDRVSRFAIGLAVVCGVLAVFSAVWLARADERVLDQIPKRQAQGKALRLEHHMALGFRRAAWAGLVVGLAGAATVGWWGRREAGPAACGPAGVVGAGAVGVGALGGSREAGGRRVAWCQPVRWREVMWVGLVAVVVSGALRWPRLGHSFWSDEGYAAREYVWGLKTIEPDGGLRFQPVPWKEALFLNERANNQVWCSIEARVAHSIWRALGGHPADSFSERALRLPAFLWGLGSVGAVAVLGAMLAGRGGSVAGLLLAVHPWHVRFAAEMRGYSAMLLALTLGILFLRVALRDGRWRWWLLSAAMNLWALLAFAGSAHVPLVFGGAAACWLAWQKRWDWLARLVMANALAAVAFLWLYGPSLIQLKAFLERGTDAGAYIVSAAWLRQYGEALCLGVPWSVMSQTWQHATWLPSASAAAWAVGAVAMMWVLRTATIVLTGPRLLSVPGLLVVAALLSIGQSVAAGTLLLMWYLLPVVIGWVLVLGAGSGVNRSGESTGACRWSGWLHVVSVLVCLAVWTSSSVAMARVPRQPIREAAQVRGSVGGLVKPLRAAEAGTEIKAPLAAPQPDALVVVGISDAQMKLYAPDVVVIKTLADLEKSEAQAEAAGISLWVSVGGWEASRQRSPEVVARLEGGAYEKVAEFPGWEPMFSYQVWRRPVGRSPEFRE